MSRVRNWMPVERPLAAPRLVLVASRSAAARRLLRPSAASDWDGDFGRALRYQQGQYALASGGDPTALEFERRYILVGPAPELAQRLISTWQDTPWHELVFYPRLPGVPHDRAMEQIELVSSRLVPALAAALRSAA